MRSDAESVLNSHGREAGTRRAVLGCLQVSRARQSGYCLAVEHQLEEAAIAVSHRSRASSGFSGLGRPSPRCNARMRSCSAFSPQAPKRQTGSAVGDIAIRVPDSCSEGRIHPTRTRDPQCLRKPCSRAPDAAYGRGPEDLRRRCYVPETLGAHLRQRGNITWINEEWSPPASFRHGRCDLSDRIWRRTGDGSVPELSGHRVIPVANSDRRQSSGSTVSVAARLTATGSSSVSAQQISQ